MLDDRPSITPRSPRAALEPEQVPLPPKRSRGARNSLVVAGNAVFTLILLAMIGVGVAYVYGKQAIETPGPLAEDKIVNIPRAGMGDIADILIREGVIEDNRMAFMGAALALGARSQMKSGEYAIPKRISMRGVIDTLVDNKVVQHSLTIPEGLTSEQIVARLLENDVLTGDIRQVPGEGTLLPETYRFPRGMTRDQLVRKMQDDHKRALQQIWERRNPEGPAKSPEQLVTLASIVEKETGRSDERSRVAAVFSNRLRQRMRLESDPTIIYGMVGGKGTLGRPIRASEIRQPTRYNTYVIDGLPPGPIANPGRASLEATANPARTRDLFFVADGTGGHAFAETLAEHNRNVARWRALEKQPANDTAERPDDTTPTSATNAPAGGPASPPAASRPAPPAKQPPSAAGKKQTSIIAPVQTAPATAAQNGTSHFPPPTVQR